MLREARRRRAVTEALAAWTGALPVACRLVRAPLRICPLGAHIDHQGGTVCGLTLDHAVLLAYVPSGSAELRVRSLEFEGEVDCAVDAVPPVEPGDWGNLVRGAADLLRREHGITRGLRGHLAGALPIGGLSSSHAVIVACLLALEQINGLSLSVAENARLAQRVEHEYVGVQSGLLDQSMILAALPGALTVLDCASGRLDWVPTAQHAHFDLVVVYCGLSRALTDTGYNQRVGECREAAAKLLQAAGRPVPEVPRLVDLPESLLETHGDGLEPALRRRATHFFGEQRRVRDGLAAWRRGDLVAFGELMTASGASSIANYECGGPEMTCLYEVLRGTPGILGARFSGAGFRGSCLGLALPGRREAIAAAIARAYPAAQRHVATSYQVHFSAPNGAAEVM